jgi:hypothetical protein
MMADKSSGRNDYTIQDLKLAMTKPDNQTTRQPIRQINTPCLMLIITQSAAPQYLTILSSSSLHKRASSSRHISQLPPTHQSYISRLLPPKVISTTYSISQISSRATSYPTHSRQHSPNHTRNHNPRSTRAPKHPQRLPPRTHAPHKTPHPTYPKPHRRTPALILHPAPTHAPHRPLNHPTQHRVYSDGYYCE